jgi:hypothetical protein
MAFAHDIIVDPVNRRFALHGGEGSTDYLVWFNLPHPEKARAERKIDKLFERIIDGLIDDLPCIANFKQEDEENDE